MNEEFLRALVAAFFANGITLMMMYGLYCIARAERGEGHDLVRHYAMAAAPMLLAALCFYLLIQDKPRYAYVVTDTATIEILDQAQQALNEGRDPVIIKQRMDQAGVRYPPDFFDNF
jgi:predicted transcriptional regulator of viral defense system